MAIIGTDSLSRTLATPPDGFFPPLTQFSDDADLRQFAWELTRTITDGAPVRVYARAANGVIENTVPYMRSSAAGTTPPSTTWALRLVGDETVQLVGFDFDVKTCTVKDAEQECLKLREMCARHGIATVMFRSGGGGFHLWARLENNAAEPFTVSELKQLGAALELIFPQAFDKAPLGNAKTGCLRAPYAPHRNEQGYSEPYTSQEPMSVLVQPTTTAEQMRAFLDAVECDADRLRVRQVAESPLTDPGRRFEKDKRSGVLRLRGKRAAKVPEFIQRLASGEVVIQDSSLRLVTYFTAAIRARWTLTEALAFGRQHPLLIESALSRPAGDGRSPRSEAAIHGYAEHQWTRAAEYVERHLHFHKRDHDPVPPPEELSRTLVQLEQAWERYIAQPGRFEQAGTTRTNTYAALLSIMARSMKPNVAAAVRDVAIATGSNRTSVSQTLTWLNKQGLVVRHRRGTYMDELELGLSRTPFTYALPDLSTDSDDTLLTLIGSYTTPPPADAPASFAELWARRNRLLATIQEHFEDVRPEMFMRQVDGGLGKKAGAVAMLLSKSPMTVDQLAKATHTPPHRIRKILAQLRGVRMISGGFGKDAATKATRSWRSGTLARYFRKATTELGLRAQLYMMEQKLWQWLLHELHERAKKHRDRSATRMTYRQLKQAGANIFPQWPVFPSTLTLASTPEGLSQRRLDLGVARATVFDHFYGVQFHVSRAA